VFVLDDAECEIQGVELVFGPTMTTFVTCKEGAAMRYLITEIPSFFPKASLKDTDVKNVTHDEEKKEEEPPVPEPSALYSRNLGNGPD
jgi:hypothetical protein